MREVYAYIHHTYEGRTRFTKKFRHFQLTVSFPIPINANRKGEGSNWIRMDPVFPPNRIDLR